AVVEAVEIDNFHQRADTVGLAEITAVRGSLRAHAETGRALHAHGHEVEIARLENTQRHDSVRKHHGRQWKQRVVGMVHETFLACGISLTCAMRRCPHSCDGASHLQCGNTLYSQAIIGAYGKRHSPGQWLACSRQALSAWR